MYTYNPEPGMVSPTDMSLVYQEENITRLIKEGTLKSYSSMISGGYFCGALTKIRGKSLVTLGGDSRQWSDIESQRGDNLEAADRWLRTVMALSPKQRTFISEKMEEIFKEVQKSGGTKDYNVVPPTASVQVGGQYYSYINARLKGEGSFSYDKAQELRKELQRVSAERYLPLFRNGGRPTVQQAQEAFAPLAEKYGTQYPGLIQAFKQGLSEEVREDLRQAGDIQAAVADYEKATSKNAEYFKSVQASGMTFREGADILSAVAYYLKNHKDVASLAELRDIMRSPDQSVMALRRMVASNFDSQKKYTVPTDLQCVPNDVKHDGKLEPRMRAFILDALLGDHPYAPMITFNSGKILNLNKPGATAEPHGAIIIGAKYDPDSKSCAYLIHNSQGTDCSAFYDPRKCEAGKIWMSEERLASTAMEVLFLNRADQN
jgi:hypothetical protein